MRELLALGLVLLVAANTVNSGAIYRRYRELELPAGTLAGAGVADGAEALPADGYVAELRNDQIPVQVVEIIEPVVVAKPVENLRSVQPVIAVPEAEPAAVITNEIIPEKGEKLEVGGESVVRNIEVVVAEKQDLPLPASDVAVEAVNVKEEQQLRNIESELPAASIDMAEKADEKEAKKEDQLPAEEMIEKKLSAEALPEAALPEPALPAAALPEAALPEALPESLPKETASEDIMEEKKAEEPAKVLNQAALPLLKAIKKDEQNAPEVPIPAEAQEQLIELNEKAALPESLPELKALKEDEPLIEATKKEEILEERKEEMLEKKKEERREEKKEELAEIQAERKEILKEAAEEAIKETIKEELKEKLNIAQPEAPKPEGEIVPSGKQADNADPGTTTARPTGFIQQLVQNTPLGQLLNTFNGNNQAASDDNTPVATAATFIQALQNTTSQITNSIQQGFQQQLQSLQTTFTGQQPQQQAAATGDAPAASTARPQGPLQSIVTSFLGNGAQSQQSAAAASQPQPAGPLQGILNLFGGNRAPAAAPIASSTPAAEAQPANDEIESAPSEAAAAPAAASDEASSEGARDSVETSDDSQEDAKPDDIVVSDDDSHE